jgi:hypothetical protein
LKKEMVPFQSLKQRTIDLALTDYRSQRAGLEIAVNRNRHSDRSRWQHFLHDAMASPLPNSKKAILLKKLA